MPEQMNNPSDFLNKKVLNPGYFVSLQEAIEARSRNDGSFREGFILGRAVANFETLQSVLSVYGEFSLQKQNADKTVI